jgi:hypothetical protein
VKAVLRANIAAHAAVLIRASASRVNRAQQAVSGMGVAGYLVEHVLNAPNVQVPRFAVLHQDETHAVRAKTAPMVNIGRVALVSRVDRVHYASPVRRACIA